MKRTYFVSTAIVALLGAAVPGCGSGAPGDESLGSTTGEATKCAGGVNGDFNYCDDPACPCDDGEGDCATDAQCSVTPGLVCGSGNGKQYGLHYSTNVCWPATCQNGVLDSGEVTIDNGGPCGCELKDYYYDYDSDGYGATGSPVRYCTPPNAKWVLTTGDCAPTDPTINPGVAEVCGDGIDNDCAGGVDNGCTVTTWCVDNDGDGYPRSTICQDSTKQPAANWLATNGSTEYDCNDNNTAIFPGATETCNGVDDDCDSQIDEGTLLTWYLDNDGDGYPRNLTTQRCSQPAFNWIQWSPAGPFDCYDANASINPGAAELCGDSIDSNCDGDPNAGCVNGTCSNGVQDSDETGVDCGGFCDVCSKGATPTSCVGLAKTCGPSGNQDCCSGSTVFGATYFRGYDGTSLYNSTANPATVNSVRMDWYEVTVGRFRKFVQAFDTWRGGGNPTAGAGAHPLIASSGWDATWTLAADAATLDSSLACDASATWTSSAGGNESLPVNCVNWYEAFAFCAWDGGRIATEAEWNLAAAGGTDQRVFAFSNPASSTSISPTNAAYGCLLDGNGACSAADIAYAGELSGGLGKYLQSDLVGNVWEWTLDWYESAYPTPCVNCANLSPATQQFKVIRGGGFQSSENGVRGSNRSIVAREARAATLGIRCVRGG